MPSQHSPELNRLRWRCRRGTRELDQLLSWWLTERYEKSDSALRAAFANMLDAPDPELWEWLSGAAKPADDGFARIADEIRTRHRI
jgi:antitoxin CptB